MTDFRKVIINIGLVIRSYNEVKMCNREIAAEANQMVKQS
jgi:hypothetical protein